MKYVTIVFKHAVSAISLFEKTSGDRMGYINVVDVMIQNRILGYCNGFNFKSKLKSLEVTG